MSDEKTLSQSRKKNNNNGTSGRQANRNMKGKSLAHKQRNANKMESADKVNSLVDGALPANGHTAVGGDEERRSKFIKQESQASSSGATADANLLNDSLITNESSLTNQSSKTSLSAGGQTDRSAGAESAQSSSEIKVRVYLRTSPRSRHNICRYIFCCRTTSPTCEVAPTISGA